MHLFTTNTNTNINVACACVILYLALKLSACASVVHPSFSILSPMYFLLFACACVAHALIFPGLFSATSFLHCQACESIHSILCLPAFGSTIACRPLTHLRQYIYTFWDSSLARGLLDVYSVCWPFGAAQQVFCKEAHAAGDTWLHPCLLCHCAHAYASYMQFFIYVMSSGILWFLLYTCSCTHAANCLPASLWRQSAIQHVLGKVPSSISLAKMPSSISLEAKCHPASLRQSAIQHLFGKDAIQHLGSSTMVQQCPKEP